MYFYCVSFSATIAAPDVWLSFLITKNPEDQRDKTNLTIYGCLVGACFIFAIVRAYGFLQVSVRCAERLHDKMVVAILQAPVLFFDSNPTGRILNRFSNDIGCVDELLPKTFLGAVQMLLLMFTAALIPIATNSWHLFAVIPLTGLAVYICKYYLNTSRELKRLESICRSPVFSHISETLIGLDTIRTRGRQRDFVDTFCRCVVDSTMLPNNGQLVYTMIVGYQAGFRSLYKGYTLNLILVLPMGVQLLCTTVCVNHWTNDTIYRL